LLLQKTAQQFLKDALDVFAMRRGVKAKELIPPSSSMDKAIAAAYSQLDKTNQGESEREKRKRERD
jgi:hypothetical protein